MASTACGYVTSILTMLEKEVSMLSKNKEAVGVNTRVGTLGGAVAFGQMPIMPTVPGISKGIKKPFLNTKNLVKRGFSLGLAASILATGTYGFKNYQAAAFSAAQKQSQAVLSTSQAKRVIPSAFVADKVVADKVVANQTLTPAEINVLVGSSYQKADGSISPYGHTALHVKVGDKEKIYDFGRYGKTTPEVVRGFTLTGSNSPSGEGILREWDSLAEYLAEESSYGAGTPLPRTTTQYGYKVSETQANTVLNSMRDLKTSNHAISIKDSSSKFETFKLDSDYHALYNNCTTLSLAPLEGVIPNFQKNASSFVDLYSGIPDASVRTAMSLSGLDLPKSIFLPENLNNYLSKSPDVKTDFVRTHKRSK